MNRVQMAIVNWREAHRLHMEEEQDFADVIEATHEYDAARAALRALDEVKP
jgi:hypothetical protein